VQSLKQLVESNQVALQATEAGYEVGTRTAVDVLQSRQRLFQAQSDYARTRYDYVLNVLALERAAGTLDENRVLRVNSWLNEPVAVK
jgi:outer membrane protein